MYIHVLLQIFTPFSLQEFWQSWMHITLIIKKPSKENLLGLPQTWTALIRTQSSLVGCQDRGLWGKVCRFCTFAKNLVRWGENFYTLFSPLKLEKNSEFWSLVYGHVYHICPLTSNSDMVLSTGGSDAAVQIRNNFVFFLQGWFPPQELPQQPPLLFGASIQHCCLQWCSFDLYLCKPCVFQMSSMGKTALRDNSCTSEFL